MKEALTRLAVPLEQVVVCGQRAHRGGPRLASPASGGGGGPHTVTQAPRHDVAPWGPRTPSTGRRIHGGVHRLHLVHLRTWDEQRVAKLCKLQCGSAFSCVHAAIVTELPLCCRTSFRHALCGFGCGCLFWIEQRHRRLREGTVAAPPHVFVQSGECGEALAARTEVSQLRHRRTDERQDGAGPFKRQSGYKPGYWMVRCCAGFPS